LNSDVVIGFIFHNVG